MTRPTVADAFHSYELRRWPVGIQNDKFGKIFNEN